jgi:hypothetical protein
MACFAIHAQNFAKIVSSVNIKNVVSGREMLLYIISFSFLCIIHFVLPSLTRSALLSGEFVC